MTPQFCSAMAFVLWNIRYARSRIYLDPDASRNVSELITSKGYPVEEYTVSTDDGYLLRMQRIPHERNDSTQHRNYKIASEGKTPVLILHGTAMSSADFVLNFPHQSLGFLLADAGYDVWLGNFRGNIYSSHARYSRINPIFWNFSFDEMVKHDLPATIDTVLNLTQQERLQYIGWSQGAQVLFGLLSERPEYNRKIALFTAMAPVAYLGRMRTPLLAFEPYADVIATFLRLTGSGGLMVNTALTKLGARLICGSDFTIDMCIVAVAVLNGINWKQLNISRLSVYLSHDPSGTSVRNVYHLTQLIRCNCFRKYDYGMLLNILNYRTWRPPRYELSRVRVPVALYHSAGDWYADPWYVARLQRELPSVARLYRVADQRFTHYDFVVGTGDEAAVLYGEMIRFMEQYRNDAMAPSL
ncbi:gastric triacylglycerol lipase-like isoform X1 [Dermacentor andersoni]|uniref:gastric triacylglycerol lipase-like isoform X1 n=1 Tax=Dermacentor andersoni TaxID=34620 RepID=UPI003B3BAD6E